MMEFDIVGSQVLHPGGFCEAPLFVSDGSIVSEPTGRKVDLTGFLVLPGIVDLHGDGFERHLAQRRGAMTQIEEGIVACEAELAANGITTAVLAQFVSWEGGMRGFPFADKVFSAIRDTKDTVVTDLHGQLRFEIHLLDLYADLIAYLDEWQVNYLVFNDHLPHDRLASGQTPRRLQGQALKAGRSPEQHLAYMKDLYDQRDQIPSALDWLCPRLVSAGTLLGSHDDATAERRAHWRSRGAHVAEFPETLEAASAASQAGDPVLMGAPNVVRGGSHNGNTSAREVVAAGLCSALASDYHYPSPRRAAFELVEAGICDLPQAWHLISSGPADVMGWSDRGILAAGKRADLVVLDAATRRVRATIAGGRVSYMTGAVVERFLG